MTLSQRVVLAAAALCASIEAGAQDRRGLSGALEGAPAAFLPPPLHPGNATLQPREIGPGVFALVASIPGVDNSGFVVGTRGVAVIDAGINRAMAAQTIAAVQAVTSLPILYLINTNYHGDHTFGNAAFPASTEIVAHEETERSMRDFSGEKMFLRPMVRGDTTVFAGVTPRPPTRTFRDKIVLDLGGRTVEVHHFGAGNTKGDAVVYEPVTRTAWVGNLVVGPVPFMLEADARTYRATIDRFRRTLDVNLIVSAHIFIGPATILEQMSAYLGAVADSVDAARARGEAAESLIARFPLPRAVLAADTPANLIRMFNGLHQLAVWHSYRSASGQ